MNNTLLLVEIPLLCLLVLALWWSRRQIKDLRLRSEVQRYQAMELAQELHEKRLEVLHLEEKWSSLTGQ